MCGEPGVPLERLEAGFRAVRAVVEGDDVDAGLAQEVRDLTESATPVERSARIVAGDAIDDRPVLQHLRLRAKVDVEAAPFSKPVQPGHRRSMLSG